MHSDILETLYMKYYNVAFIYTLSLCKQRQLAEDIVGDAFERAFITVNSDKKDFKYWLLAVCKNLWIDYLRKNKRKSDIPLEDYNFAAENMDLIEKLIVEEKQRKIYEEIMKLPKNYREILIMHYYVEIPIVAIAKILHISNANAKVLIHRARAKLKESLEEYIYER